jgi:hypothetical protein
MWRRCREISRVSTMATVDVRSERKVSVVSRCGSAELMRFGVSRSSLTAGGRGSQGVLRAEARRLGRVG